MEINENNILTFEKGLPGLQENNVRVAVQREQQSGKLAAVTGSKRNFTSDHRSILSSAVLLI